MIFKTILNLSSSVEEENSFPPLNRIIIAVKKKRKVLPFNLKLKPVRAYRGKSE